MPRSATPAAIRSAPAADARIRPNRLTIASAVALLVISILHTAAFSLHPWWGAWMAGPFRTAQLPVDAAVQFWGLPGGFVVPGVLLALFILRIGRGGDTVPLYVPLILGSWALLCVWMVGPSGFMLILIPAVLLLIATLKSRRTRRP